MLCFRKPHNSESDRNQNGLLTALYSVLAQQLTRLVSCNCFSFHQKENSDDREVCYSTARPGGKGATYGSNVMTQCFAQAYSGIVM